MLDEYTLPESITGYLAKSGLPNPYGAMRPFIARWMRMLTAKGDFYDYEDKVDGQRLKIHRRSIRPAAKVAEEWASLLMTDKTTVATDDEAANEWLGAWMDSTGFLLNGSDLVKDAFALGTAAWALWLDVEGGRMVPRRYDARQVIPISWDDGRIVECAFASRASYRGQMLDQLTLHLRQADGYHILSRAWDTDGREVVPDGTEADFATGCPYPTFAVVRPAVKNTRVDMSPYGQSVYADAVDALEAVDLAFDAIFNEVDLTKARIFVADMLVDYGDGDGQSRPLPFGRDNTVFRKVAATSDLVEVFAPQMRTSSQKEAYELALRAMGGCCGFGESYFVERSGLRTATEVSSDNSQLMRNIRKHEKLLAGAICDIVRAAVFCAKRHLGQAQLPDYVEVAVGFDDSIIQDTAAEKAQDMAELNVTLNPWEFRMKWYGEDEATARANVPGAQEAAAPLFEG
ncbi:hypothetical protein AAY81_03990 [Denitrobacterium detoxificans]|uniref:Phage portal protein, putative, A118 family n=1 Tax=Denitrobacterium detoxificans TaxID=79604 RepID=A0A172RXF3_9ACTN|nr:phage portal protein [Denitrobacterium detoxificans]ANE22421.1 hypothetical protein AAY81_03990 [Denitrobacterium detoxificans]SEO82024.1 phage portal protein, putative, A118 family [Denitrobacterium detoxificans]SEP01890.1 phage portal protein, putative, A118 family [Denitrobacterium detoxificans]